MVTLATVAASFLLHPTSLFALAAVFAAWVYAFIVKQGQPLVLGGRAWSEREKTMGLAAVSFITLFFLTNVGTVLFSALSISSAAIALHGAARAPDDLFTMDEAAGSQSLLSILTGGATSSSAAPGGTV